MINQLQLANTFNEWRITTNDLIGVANDLKEGNLQTTGTITIDNLNGYRNNVAINVATGTIRGDGGLLSNTGAVGSIKNDRLQNNSITINWNNPQVGLSSNTINLGQAIFLNVTNLVTNVNDTSTSNIASANVVNTVHVVAMFANAVGNYSTARVNAVSDSTNAAFVLANTTSGTLSSLSNTITNTSFTAVAAYNHANTRYSANGGTISGDVSITGNLSVLGNTTLITANTLSVTDPLIYLAANNYSSDLVDIGFIANYVNATGANVHTGLYREHADKMYYLFQGYDQEPFNNHLGALSNNMSLAVLNANVRTSNILLNGINVTSWLTAAFDTANIAIANVNFVNTEASAAFSQANIAAANVNYVNTMAVAAFTTANIAIANVTYANAMAIYANGVALYANSNALFNIAGQAGRTFTGNLTATGVFADQFGNLRLSYSTTTAATARTLRRGDIANLVLMATNTSGTQSNTYVPEATFVPGDSIILYNNTSTAQTIRPNLAVVKVLLANSSTANSHFGATRNVNANSVVTLYCIAANTFVLTGVGAIE